MDYKINTTVLLSNGSSVSDGVIVSFNPHTDAITKENKIPTDLSWFISEEAQEAGWSKVIPCTDAVKRVETQILNVYLQSDVPVNKLSYDVIQQYGLIWLEGIYGSGNVQILN